MEKLKRACQDCFHCKLGSKQICFCGKSHWKDLLYANLPKIHRNCVDFDLMEEGERIAKDLVVTRKMTLNGAWEAALAEMQAGKKPYEKARR